ncbi:thioredoxin domain protein [Natronomonas pharaonis DSM 2160]|uniref:Thioredoxin domain protein n=1 Tax=Natronomonas pharaonis (strain ATCC 35678 / DSM 2160 / CIP 103997 / JCM 8858 / NBRC 14720 / NCIMB 2260 / Gabara) TaxID=348780 RepID=A0A1U7EUJ6_NATPD|nr:(2Fe-2S) ferredoxin domain-containing protein [Natronomonas pharaonis]CAI48641.1 thioredoxin domain protein [Natronomonas pharaonis DSM 2160]
MQRRTDEQTTRLDAYVFVCTNARDSEYAACADAGPGAEATVEAVTEWLRERDVYWNGVGVSTTDCLGLCSEGGTALTIQPHDEWFSDVTPEDVPELLAEAFGPDAAQLD